MIKSFWNEMRVLEMNNNQLIISKSYLGRLTSKVFGAYHLENDFLVVITSKIFFGPITSKILLGFII